MAYAYPDLENEQDIVPFSRFFKKIDFFSVVLLYENKWATLALKCPEQAYPRAPPKRYAVC
jgi:hypothetical protein